MILSKIIALMAVLVWTEVQTKRFSNYDKQRLHEPVAFPADPDDIGADDAIEVINSGQKYLDKLENLCKTVGVVADDINLDKVANVAKKSLGIIKKLGFYGDLVVSLIELFTGEITDKKKNEMKDL
jgi:hypothetical protein